MQYFLHSLHAIISSQIASTTASIYLPNLKICTAATNSPFFSLPSIPPSHSLPPLPHSPHPEQQPPWWGSVGAAWGQTSTEWAAPGRPPSTRVDGPGPPAVPSHGPAVPDGSPGPTYAGRSLPGAGWGDVWQGESKERDNSCDKKQTERNLIHTCVLMGFVYWVFELYWCLQNICIWTNKQSYTHNAFLSSNKYMVRESIWFN